MVGVAPGFAFSLPSDLGFIVGLVTHQVDRIGDLVWVAQPIFDEEPGLVDAQTIQSWRWPIFFPSGAALRRKIISPVGTLPIPLALKSFPHMRGGNKQMGWREVHFGVDGQEEVLGAASSAKLPVYRIVNDTRLKEMVISGWTPEQEW